MASVDVAEQSDLDPAQAWKLASDLSRFDEWLTIFAGWRSDVPDSLDVGTEVASCIKVKGFRNVIHWRVTRYDEPNVVEMKGSGRGGVRIGLSLRVEDEDRGSEFKVSADLSGGLLSTPVGSMVAKVLKSDVRKSVSNLASLR